MEDNQNIKNSLKATTLFGGVQVFKILVSIIRSKLIAILIGPAGFGIISLYTSTIDLIGSFTNFSLSTSAVRNLSIAYNSEDASKFRHVSSIFSKIVWLTGLLGLFVCLMGSPLWSQLTFGSYNYTLSFALLSIVLLFNQLTSAKTVLLQSTRHFRHIAYSGIIGNFLGLVTTIPIYYFWRIKGIVAVLILSAIFPYLLGYYYASQLDIKKEEIGNKEVIKEGSGIFKQGFLLSINFLLSTLIFYILRVFINKQGGAAEVGVYTAGFALVTSYVGLIIQSMGQEYYPRISAISSKNKEFNDAIDNQIYLSLLLMGPLVIIFIAFGEQLLVLLYSNKFVDATVFMSFSMLGVIFQAPSWCMGYAFLSKGDHKTFLIYESIAKTQKLVTDITFYLLWGLTGIGISFLVSYLYYTIQCLFICKRRYGFILSRANLRLLVLYFILGAIVLAATICLPTVVKFSVGAIAIIGITVFSYKKLNEIVNIKLFLINKLSK